MLLNQLKEKGKIFYQNCEMSSGNLGEGFTGPQEINISNKDSPPIKTPSTSVMASGFSRSAPFSFLSLPAAPSMGGSLSDRYSS